MHNARFYEHGGKKNEPRMSQDEPKLTCCSPFVCADILSCHGPCRRRSDFREQGRSSSFQPGSTSKCLWTRRKQEVFELKVNCVYSLSVPCRADCVCVCVLVFCNQRSQSTPLMATVTSITSSCPRCQRGEPGFKS